MLECMAEQSKGTTLKETAAQIEFWETSRCIPYARNPRCVPDLAISKVAGSIKEFGFRQPIVVDAEGVIIAGHTRLLAAERLGLERVPVLVAVDLTPAQVKAYRLADNRTAQEATWDPELLNIELEDLAGLDIDLSLTGFGSEEIAALLASPTEGLTGPDSVPEPPTEPVSRSGDLWLLGCHRLLCGDSTSHDDVRHLMDSKRASLMATDPPYLVDYDGGNHPPTWANKGKSGDPDCGTKHWDAYTDHDSSVKFYSDFLQTALASALTETPIIYQWFGMMRAEVVFEAWRSVGLLPHQVLVWVKSRHILSRCDFMWNYEPCMYGWIEGKRPESERRPPANATAAWEIDSTIEDGAAGIHPTMKPVETVRRPIEWHTRPGGLIYEPFSGSGTAIIAAEMTGRICYALELAPAYVDVAVRRWENFTGKKATRGS